jgi:hypothetical protein
VWVSTELPQLISKKAAKGSFRITPVHFVLPELNLAPDRLRPFDQSVEIDDY